MWSIANWKDCATSTGRGMYWESDAVSSTIVFWIPLQEIEKIQKSMREIQQMFFDLALLVDEQGELLDYVQINVA